MRITFIFTIIIGFFAFAYISADRKINSNTNIHKLHLGMTVKSLEKIFGTPVAKNQNQLTYIFDDSSELVVTLRDNEVSSAQLKYHQPLKIEDPQIKKLTLVQMNTEGIHENRPSWFFAGKPEEGLIYKITSDGVIESLTWVPAFSYETKRPKLVGLLFKDFHDQLSSKM